MKLTDEQLKAILELAGKATAGPWKYIDNEGDYPPSWISAGEATGYDEEDNSHSMVCQMPSTAYGYETKLHNNGPYIAALSPDVVTSMVRELRAAREVIQYVACEGKDDGDFHADQFRATEIAIAMANRARQHREEWQG